MIYMLYLHIDFTFMIYLSKHYIRPSMPDVSFWATLVSTGGAVLAGVGAVAVTNWGAMRRDAMQSERLRQEQRAEVLRQACAGLLAAAEQLRVQMEIACQRQWRDMNARVSAIEQCASEVGLRVSQVALIGGKDVAQVARSFANEATGLAAALVKNTKMGDQKLGDKAADAGYVEPLPGFAKFDAELDRLYQAIAGAIDRLEGPRLPGVLPSGE
jgi:hypothetical protein